MRILIADDDDDDRILASAAFKEINLGLDVDFVKDGQELLESLSNEVKDKIKLPDLILFDLNMPKKDGREALKELKADPQLKFIDVIVFSTSTSEMDKEYTRQLGAINYIVKPSDYRKMMEVFRNISNQLMDAH